MVNDYSTLQGTSYLQPLEQFDYTQNVASLYLSTKWELTKKWGAVVGLRAENTQITGQWNSKIDDSWLINSKGQFENEYTTLLPSFILSRKIDMMKSIKASYSKRISRPGMRYINPNTSYTDVFSKDEGNPYLKPRKK